MNNPILLRSDFDGALNGFSFKVLTLIVKHILWHWLSCHVDDGDFYTPWNFDQQIIDNSSVLDFVPGKIPWIS